MNHSPEPWDRVTSKGDPMRVAIWDEEAEEVGEYIDENGETVVEMAGAWEEVVTKRDLERVLDWVLAKYSLKRDQLLIERE